MHLKNNTPQNEALKIVIFDGSFSTRPFINRLVEGLVKYKHEVYIFGFNEEIQHKIPNIKYVGLGSNQSFYSFIKTSLVLGFSSSFQKGFNALFNILNKDRKKLQKQNLDLVLKRIQPDIIHLQWPSLLPWIEPYLQNKTPKLVLSQLGSQTNIKPFINQDFYDQLQRYYPKMDGIHSVSKAITSKGRSFYTPTTTLEKVIYTGFNLKFLEFNLSQQRQKQLHILSVGRPHWVKGYNAAIKAMHLLKQSHIEFDYQIIGAANDEELLFLIDDLGLKDEVKLFPQMKQEAVYAKIKKADVLLLPSIEEGIANVAVEAMALGTPVISTNCGGMQELITHEKEGWIVPIRNPEAIAQQIKQFTQISEEELKAIKLAARNKVERQHSEKQMTEDMIDLYKRVLYL